MPKISELTAITELTDSDIVMVTDAETSASKKITWSNIQASISSLTSDIVQTPSATVTPANNGELMVEATNNTTLTFKYKGSDGTVRSGTITLS